MTQNQIAYWNLQETERANKEKEHENRRANKTKEFETARHNRETERVADFSARMQDNRWTVQDIGDIVGWFQKAFNPLAGIFK